jgi:hypothetical protein
MKRYAFPIKVILEVVDDAGEYTTMLTFLVKDNTTLCNKLEIIKTLYVTDREYRLIFILQSKMNVIP